MLPKLPPDQREELEGIAEGCGAPVLEILFLNTHYALAAHVGGRESPAFWADVVVKEGPELLRRFAPGDEESLRDLMIVVHEDRWPCLVLAARPGMVGGFFGILGNAAAGVRPIETVTRPVLTGVPWPCLLRVLLERPPTPGGSLPAATTRAASVPMVRPDGSVGTLNVSPAGGTWYRGFEGYAISSEAPVRGLDGKVSLGRVPDSQRMMAGERARRALTAHGSPEMRLVGGRKGVQITYTVGDVVLRRVVRFRR